MRVGWKWRGVEAGVVAGWLWAPCAGSRCCLLSQESPVPFPRGSWAGAEPPSSLSAPHPQPPSSTLGV